MTTKRITMRALATLSLWAGFGLSAFGQLPALTLDKAFETKPRQPGVVIATPAPDQIARHKIDPVKGKEGATIGYVVRDADGKPVRQFVSYDNKTFSIMAYYTNGQETYRETYPPDPKVPFQFRWLGPNGGKYGLDHDRDGRIDEWFVLSPEEASQELLQAVLTRDPKRLEALLPTEDQLKRLGLPPAEIARIKEKSAGAMKKLTDAAAALKLTPAAKWHHLELGAPQTTPADSFNGTDDQVVHKNGTILIEDEKDGMGGKKETEHKYMQTGEMVLIGRSWKIVEGPSVGPGGVEGNQGGSPEAPVVTKEIEDLVKQLDDLDKNYGMGGVPADKMAEYYGKRAAILELIVAKLKPEQQGGWAKLLIESLANAAEAGADGGPAHLRLKQLKDAFVAAPQNPLGPYASFRLLVAENGMALSKATKEPEIKAAQEKWRVGLEAFVGAFPKSDDAGEAVMRLIMAYEFMGKDGEPKAKTWCEHLIKNYATHHHAAKAAGIIKRLESEGKPLEIAGTNMATGMPFNPQQISGKPVVVFYWATWSQTLAEDAKKLKDLAATYGPKGLEIICVALDDDAATAGQSIQKAGLPGTHLHAKGGLDGSPLATNYGILVVPHIFVVGKDGKIVKRSGEIATLEDDVKKLTTP